VRQSNKRIRGNPHKHWAAAFSRPIIGLPSQTTVKQIKTTELCSTPVPCICHVTIGDIVSTIASTHGYTPKVSDALSRINVLHLDQTDESDLHFLTRLARENNAISKPAGGHWLFVTKGEGKSASGIELPEINVNTTELISHRLTHAERGKYSSVIAHWHDVKKGQRIPVRAGVDEPVYSMRHNYPDESQALRAANSKLLSLSRGVQSLSLTVVGGTKYQAEGRLNLSGLRAPLNNSWLIIRVAHQLGPGGFVTRVDAEAPS